MRRRSTASAALASLALAIAACMPSDGSNGTWRTVSWVRLQPGEETDSLPLLVNVAYAAGRVSLRGASAPLLYRAALTWDASQTPQPSFRFDSGARQLALELDRGSLRWRGPDASDAAGLRLALSREVPVELDLSLNGTASDLDLTGLRLWRATIRSGMGDVTVHLDEPNRLTGRELRLENEFGRLEAQGLGNANVGRVRARSSFGALELDFSGRWSQDVTLDLDANLAVVELRVPEDIGVEIAVDGNWGDPPAGWTRTGGTVTSPNWDAARHRLRVAGSVTLARLRVR